MNKVKVAKAISTTISFIGSAFLLLMLVWGVIHRPLGTFLFIGFIVIIGAAFWSMVVLMDDDIEGMRKKDGRASNDLG